MKGKKIIFDTQIVKQGNSACIRISKFALDYLGLEIGDLARINVTLPKKEKMPKELLDIYRKTIPGLRNFNFKELNDCFFLFSIESNTTKNLNRNEKSKTIEAFEQLISLQKSKLFLKKYKTFKKSITKNNMKKIYDKLKNSKFLELTKAIDMQSDFYYKKKQTIR